MGQPCGTIRADESFIVPVPQSIDPEAFDTVVVWCESFGEFITAARYRRFWEERPC
jgi:hypothetical protein